MKKRIFAFALLLTLAFLLTACDHAHTYGPWQVEREATCTSAGSEIRTCECGTTESRAIPATGHTEGDWETLKNPTCTEDGTKRLACGSCGITLRTETIPALGHNEVKLDGKAATCTASGLTEGKKCDVCGTVIVPQVVIPATGHTEGEWITDKNATATQDGSKHQVCSVCGVTIKTETIPATGLYTNVVMVGHSWTLHNASPTIGWFDARGMAASVPGNDFARLLEAGMEARTGEINLQKLNASSWERNYDGAISIADPYLSGQTDLIVIRLGENVLAEETAESYGIRLLAFIEHMKTLAPNADIVVATTGIGRLKAVTKETAEKAGAMIAEADMSDSNCYGKLGQYVYYPNSTYEAVVNGYHPIIHSGVASHPSDVGMAIVANSVLSAIGYNQIQVTYPISYQGIVTSEYTNNTKWVRGGLVTVNSTTPISVVTTSGRVISDITDHGNGFYTFFMPAEGVIVSPKN